MKQWSADFGNDPFNDYNLIVEVLFNHKDVALIKQGKNGLEIKWYPHTEELIVPLDWFLDLMKEVKKRLNI